MKLSKSNVKNIIREACESKFDNRIDKATERLSIKIGNLILQEVEIGWEKFSKHIQISKSIELKTAEKYNGCCVNDYGRITKRERIRIDVKPFPYFGTPKRYLDHNKEDLSITDRILSGPVKKDAKKVFDLLKNKGEMFEALYKLLGDKKSTGAVKKLVPELEKYFPIEVRRDLPEDTKLIEQARLFFK